MSIHRASVWLDGAWATLPKGIWVAAISGGVVAENQDLALVYSYLRQNATALGIKISDVAIVFVPDGVVQ